MTQRAERMKVIIVEDEPRVRKGLSESIDWETHDMELVGTAANGLEGLELFQEKLPDLVIADIRMPIMNGLAMTESILEIQSDTRIMIISGHDEFEYAQKCVALGVTDYLLKPIGKKQFLQEVSKIVQAWRNDFDQKQQTLRFKQEMNNHLPLLRNAFLEEWLNGTGWRSEEQLKEHFSFLHIAVDFDLPVAVAIFEPDFADSDAYSHDDRKLFEFSLHNMLEELLQEMGIAYLRGNGQTVVIYQSLSDHPEKDLFIWANRAKGSISAFLPVSVSAGISSRSAEVAGLPRLFQESLRVLRLKMIAGADNILHEGMIQPAQSQPVIFHEADAALLLHGVELHDLTEIRSVLHKCFARWRESHVPYPEEIFYQLAGLFSGMCHRLGQSVYAFIDEEQQSLWKSPEHFSSLQEMEEWWLHRFTALSRQFEGLHKDRKTQLVEEVMNYVQHNIYEPLTREQAAQHVFINSSYLSRIFREVTGEAFSDFVLRKKMEQAIHLLQQEREMVYEVADKLGYKDPSYFARVFKKYTGKSPSEFQ